MKSPALIGSAVANSSTPNPAGEAGALVPTPVKVSGPAGLRIRSLNGPPAAPLTRQRTTVPSIGDVTRAPGSGRRALNAVPTPFNSLGAKLWGSGAPTVTVAAEAAVGAQTRAAASAIHRMLL